MYVCLCNGISDRQIREVVDRGADSLHAVQAHLPVANCCGQCEDCAREIIDDHHHRVAAARVVAA